MWVLPGLAAIVSAVFAAITLRRFFDRTAPYNLAWGAALLMFAVASFAAAIGMVGGWTPTKFRTYYFFGAIMNVPVLALGTLYLLARKSVARVAVALVALGGVFAMGAVFTAELDITALAVTGAIPAGSDVMPDAVRSLSRYYSYGGFAVVLAGALGSAWRLSRAGDDRLRQFARANLLIALGVIIVALGSGFARFGRGSVLAVGLLVGVTVMFAGFLRAGRGPST